MKSEGSVVMYRGEDGKSAIKVRVESETVWLSLNQISELFGRDKSVVSRHIHNIFKDNELKRDSVVAFFATTAEDGKTYRVEYFSLDLIISVGYRVKSLRGTQFRIWANGILREYLLKGYALNEMRLRAQSQKIRELEDAISMLSGLIEHKQLTADEATGLLRVITDYTYALDLLDRYDHQTLEVESTSGKDTCRIDYASARKAIAELGKRAGTVGLFGKEKDNSLKSSLSTIYQTFDGRELYPSIEEKAANLLYFIVKNHSFIDGNKRIAAFLFLWFLEKNRILYKSDGSRRIADNALVALTLMVAESAPKERETMVRVVVSLINRRN